MSTRVGSRFWQPLVSRARTGRSRQRNVDSGPLARPRMSRDRMNLFGFVPGYGTYIYDSGREPAFLVLLAFILTLAGTRFYTRMARVRGWGSAIVGDVHVHHLVPGVVLSLVAGGLALAFEPREFWVAFLAAVFGAGAALVLDEFGCSFTSTTCTGRLKAVSRS